MSARRSRAAQLLGLTIRSLQRWAKNGIADKRKGSRASPANKMSDGERQQIINTLDSKWIARAQLDFTPGEYEANLIVTVDDVDFTSGKFSFSLETDTPTGLFPAIELDRKTFDNESQSYKIYVKYINTYLISKIKFEVLKKDNTQILEEFHTTFDNTIAFSIPANLLSPGEEYTYQISVLGPDNTVLTNEAGENLIYADIIEYDPENTKVLLVLDPHQIVNDSIIISAHIENESMVGSYKGFIKNELTGAVPLNISKPFSENPIQIPLASLEPLQYDILVQAFDQNGSLLAQDEQSFTYIPQKPSLFSRWRRLKALPNRCVSLVF